MSIAKLNELGLEIFNKRYSYPGETEWADRAKVIAKTAASAERDEEKEKWASKFFEVISSGDLVPGGRIIYGSGRNNGRQNLLNCYVLHPGDSVESIGKCISDTYKISCGGGGIGYNFSDIRPKGDEIQNQKGSAPGAVSVMKMINEIGEHVRAGKNRRVALIAILNVTHPDLFEFLTVKLDKHELTNFNISVGITSRFIEACKNDEDWYFTFGNKKYYVYGVMRMNHEGESSLVQVVALNEDDAIMRASEHYKTDFRDTFAVVNKINIKAKDIWDRIWSNAVKSGDPGIFNVDLANTHTTVNYFETLNATNPCIVGGTKILTVNGPVTIKELVDGNCKDCNGTGSLGENGHNGNNIDCTSCNNTGRKNQDKIKLYAWDPESKLPVIRNGYNPRLTARNAEILEVEFDSGLKVKCTLNHNFRSFRGDKVEAQNLKIGQSVRAFSVSKHRDGHLRAHGWVANKTAHQWVHRMVWEEANGEIPEGYVIHHKDENPQNNNLSNLELISAYDHQSKHYPERVKNGFHHPNMVREEVLNHKVVAIRSAGREDVYNITVEDVHTYIICDDKYAGEGPDGVYSGIVSCNCGEITLPEYGNCCLGNINLSNMVVNGEFDWKRFAKAVRYGVRFLDNILEVNYFPIPECREVGHKSRRVGLGVLGYHYMLIKLGIRYGSEKCLEFTQRLAQTMRDEAYTTSVYLSRDKGPFPAFNSSKYLNTNFAKTLPARIRMLIKEHGIRNAVMLTIPPTGTISMLWGVSSGVEPIFAPLYIRRYRDANVWKETTVIDPLLKEYIDEGKIFELSPYTGSVKLDVFAGAYDITPEEHMAVQATWQQYIDSAISKTINLPKEATPESLSDKALEYAEYVKGLTIYRAGSRGNEPLEAIPLTESNIKTYLGYAQSIVADGSVCSITDKECGA